MQCIHFLVWPRGTQDVIYAQQIHNNAMLRKHASTSPGAHLEIQHLLVLITHL